MTTKVGASPRDSNDVELAAEVATFLNRIGVLRDRLLAASATPAERAELKKLVASHRRFERPAGTNPHLFVIGLIDEMSRDAATHELARAVALERTGHVAKLTADDRKALERATKRRYYGDEKGKANEGYAQQLAANFPEAALSVGESALERAADLAIIKFNVAFPEHNPRVAESARSLFIDAARSWGRETGAAKHGGPGSKWAVLSKLIKKLKLTPITRKTAETLWARRRRTPDQRTK